MSPGVPLEMCLAPSAISSGSDEPRTLPLEFGYSSSYMGEVSSGADLIKSDVISQRNYKDNACEVASPT